MSYTEIKGDIFERGKREKNVWFVQCISRDLAMGAGIAVTFNKEFNLKWLARNRWTTLTEEQRRNIKCFRVERVFNLITKEKYYHKPTIESMSESLDALRGNISSIIKSGKEVKEIRLPLIGCGLDRLKWNDVKPLLMEKVVNKFPGIDFRLYYLREEDLNGYQSQKEKI